MDYEQHKNYPKSQIKGEAQSNAEEKVFFPEKRSIHQKGEEFPWNCIGLLRLYYQQDKKPCYGVGTAFLISPFFLLTAAHNLYDGKHNYTLTFYPKSTQRRGLEKESIKIDRFYKSDKFVPKTYEKSPDYALCRLQKPVKRQQYINLYYDCKLQTLLQKNIYLYGYPKDIQQKTQQYETFQLFGSQGPIANTHHDYIQYKISTNKGQSGSPILFNIDDKWYAIGHHVGSTNAKQSKLQQSNQVTQEYNQASHYTNEKIQIFMKWIRQLTVYPRIANLQTNQPFECQIAMREVYSGLNMNEMKKNMEERQQKQKEINKLKEELELQKQKREQLEKRVQILRDALTNIASLSTDGAQEDENPES